MYCLFGVFMKERTIYSDVIYTYNNQVRDDANVTALQTNRGRSLILDAHFQSSVGKQYTN